MLPLRRLLFASVLLASVLPAARAASAPAVDRFGFHEVALTASGAYANPYTDCAATATLTAPDGTVRTLPLFWDGGATWRLRVSPDRIGDWRWSVASPDAALNGKSGAFACRASTRRGSLQPMAGAPHHFQYQNGERTWFLGDTAWSFVTDVPAKNHHEATVTRYLQRRASQGFNVVHTMLLSEAGDGNAGGVPFAPLAEEKLNPAYWQAIDRRVAAANSAGVVMGLALAWGRKVAGSDTAEPWAWGRFPSQAARERYARYIAARYGAYDVYFLVAGEWHAELRTRPTLAGPTVRDEFVAIGNALRAADAHRRMTGIHPMSKDGSVREFNRAAWMDFADYQQNYRHLHDRVLTSRHYAKPVVNSEYAYFLRDYDGDGRADKEHSLTIDDIRHASWDIAMAGGYFVTGFGTTYFGGNRDPGPFDPSAAKNGPWETQLAHLKKFFTSLDWWKLIPADAQVSAATPRSADRTQRVEPAQPGGRVRNVARAPETAYWALQNPGELYVIYVRGLAEPVAFDIDAVGGDYLAERFDPRTAARADLGSVRFAEQVDQAQIAAVGGSAAPATKLGTRYTFTPPDAQDWIVVLRRARP